MKQSNITDLDIPNEPGVYFFKRGDEVLYIGKATSLRDRVKSYFNSRLEEARGPRIEKMVGESDKVEWQETESVLEALILEANSIKKEQPPYNVKEKDQKSFNYVVITNEDYPRVFTVRGRELQLSWDPDDIKYSFGPYPHGAELKEALRLIRKIFPFRGRKDPMERKRRRSRLNEQIGLAPKIASGDITKQDYQRTIRNLKLFFEGKKGKLIGELHKDMENAVQAKDFEKAGVLKKQIFALRHIRDVSLIKERRLSMDTNVGYRVEGYDIAHLGGESTVGVMVVCDDGQPTKSQYRKFKIKKGRKGSDTDALREVIERRLSHDEWTLPKLFVIDGGKQQRNVAMKVLEDSGVQIPVVSVVKNNRHKPKEILGDKDLIHKHEKDILIAASEAHRFAQNYHKNLRRNLRR